MSTELEKTAYALIGGFIGVLLSSIVKWYTDKKDRKKIKTAEFFSAFSKYVDYILTITFYPKSHIENNYEHMLLHLELLKSQFIESQCLLVAYNYKEYLKTKNIVSEAIDLDGNFTGLIFTVDYTDEQLQSLNDKAFSLIKKTQSFIEDSNLE